MRETHAYTSYTGPQQPLHYLTQDRPLNKNIRKTQAPIQYPSSRTPKYLSPNTHPHPLRKPRHHQNAAEYQTWKTPPFNSEEEIALSRKDKVHLSLLRYGHHPGPALPSYTKRVNVTETDTCTLCNNAEGNLEHIILHCPHIHTHRARYNIQSLEHLWTRPVEVYNFLHDAGVLQSTRTSPPHTQ